MTAPYFLGIDIGTQGARVVLIDVTGILIATAAETFPLTTESREEQSAQTWWESCIVSMRRLLREAAGYVDLAEIKALSVTSTSGTVIPIDAAHQPLHNALMYSDQRSRAESIVVTETARQNNSNGYTGFNSSSGLSKMVWYAKHFPERLNQISGWIHATDYIIGRLSGCWHITDFTNALKSGYDVHHNCWPEYLYTQLPLRRGWLPEVVAPGTPIGTLDATVAQLLGLNRWVVVVAGMTDGCASQVASGAMKPGQWNTTIGTTLVVKGVTVEEIKDPQERLYCHRHPEGFWMPGGASNIGADWVTEDFAARIDELNTAAQMLIPTGKIAYPLRQEGERFPFIAPQARGFQEEGLSYEERFAASMEGVAYVERYTYEMTERLCGEKVEAIFTAGGASNSGVWLTIRSNVLNRPIYKMKHVSGAVGAAIVAASKTHFSNIVEATQALTQLEKAVQPQAALVTKYDDYYHQFLSVLAEKGFINNDTNA